MEKKTNLVLELKSFLSWLIVLLVVLNLFLVFRIFSINGELKVLRTKFNFHKNTNVLLNEKIANLLEEKEKIYEENKKLQTSMDYYRKKALHQSMLSSKEISELREKGLKDPVKDIRADLMKRNELIPYKGVLGGTMRFASEIDIHILSTQWVRAYFEDGHVGGWILLEYQISEEGTILWKVIDSYLDSYKNL
jgi:hypothetical protein